MSTQKLKLCIDCKWYGEWHEFQKCKHPGAGMISPVTGHCEPAKERLIDGNCGREGALWEPKEKVQELQKMSAFAKKDEPRKKGFWARIFGGGK